MGGGMGLVVLIALFQIVSPLLLWRVEAMNPGREGGGGLF